MEMRDVPVFIENVQRAVNLIEEGMHSLETNGVKFLEGEFYMPIDVPDIYIERLETLQEKLDNISAKLQNLEEIKSVL